MFGGTVTHEFLKSKLEALWKLPKLLCLIDLWYEFFTAKFKHRESHDIVLQKRPWFVEGSFISIRRWEPNFVPSISKINFIVIWIRLPQLPTEFFDLGILERIGRKIGKLLKVNACTSSLICGQYARICVQMELGKSVKTSITVGNHKQILVYEGEKNLCRLYGCLGHTTHSCPEKTQDQISASSSTYLTSIMSEVSVQEWQTVQFPQRKNQHRLVTPIKEIVIYMRKNGNPLFNLYLYD
ncbi:uncharacterized protein LOC124888027 [Capsicum annuum]|uniref:uncharacterized protein LOC124888027 n=1 Tax=Capsicum annuum TaxID=4072 RepID=UPI001FB15EE8|nr:uncharacterized protein LOC124888027 [Capsicum annuum]